jgi:hypothetical protein
MQGMDVLLLEGSDEALLLEGQPGDEASLAVGLDVFTMGLAFTGAGTITAQPVAVRDLGDLTLLGSSDLAMDHTAVRDLALALLGGSGFDADQIAVRHLALDLLGTGRLSLAAISGVVELPPLALAGGSALGLGRLRRPFGSLFPAGTPVPASPLFGDPDSAIAPSALFEAPDGAVPLPLFDDPDGAASVSLFEDGESTPGRPTPLFDDPDPPLS